MECQLVDRPKLWHASHRVHVHHIYWFRHGLRRWYRVLPGEWHDCSHVLMEELNFDICCRAGLVYGRTTMLLVINPASLIEFYYCWGDFGPRLVVLLILLHLSKCHFVNNLPCVLRAVVREWYSRGHGCAVWCMDDMERACVVLQL